MIKIEKTDILKYERSGKEKKFKEDEKFYTKKIIRDEIKPIIYKDFFNLCYLCEANIKIRFAHIEHFYGKGKEFFPEKINDWNNLFLSCSFCNSTKPKNINKENEEILNPSYDDVENLIILKYDKKDKYIKITTTPKKNNQKIENTIKILERIYNGKGSKSLGYSDIIKDIKNIIEDFCELLNNYKTYKSIFLKNKCKQQIINFIQKKYILKSKNIDCSFISFKRQIIKDNPDYKEFEKYFD